MVSAAEGSSILPLTLRGVGYSVAGRVLLDAVDLEIGPEGRTLILGANGAGKSLLLRLCHGLLQPGAGSIRWSDGPTRAGDPRHAMVFQRPILLRRSARANILHALAMIGLPAAERRQRAEETLARFGLGALAERPARVLSGGEQQRLAMARAWSLKPQVLFLDEPTSALDPAGTRAVEEMIAAFAEGGTKIVMTTHDLAQARRLADEVVFLHQGRLAERTGAAEFFDMPASAPARSFLKGELPW
ncbi:MAG: ATP-binding cassette domain-containing protein [Alphaproteobacteria bacterium]|nr:ATP-binding cassette domain-containing protein [Alphaproteobacteria bacterium]